MFRKLNFNRMGIRKSESRLSSAGASPTTRPTPRAQLNPVRPIGQD